MAVPSELALLILFFGFFVLAFIEGLFWHFKDRFDWRDFAVSTVDLFVRLGLVFLLPYTGRTSIGVFLTTHRLFHFDSRSWVAIALLFIGVDFMYYVFHWSCHRFRWFWIYHRAHHTSPNFTLATGYRLGILEKFVGVAGFFAVLVWLGFSIDAVQCMILLNTSYQLLVHVAWIPKLGWLEHVFNTPANHRIHHAQNPEYVGKNLGGALIVFDRLFGTYVAETAPCIFKRASSRTDYNPLSVELGEALSLFKEIIRVRGFARVCTLLVERPRIKADE